MNNSNVGQRFDRNYSWSTDQRETLPSTVPPTPSQCMLVSSIENIQNETPKDLSELPITFKAQWVNTTLKFVTDDTWTTLKYPEMTMPQVEFVHSLILYDNIYKYQESGEKSLYTSLKEAMKIISLKYEFKASILEATKPNMLCLLVEKIAKEIILTGTNTKSLKSDTMREDNAISHRGSNPLQESKTLENLEKRDCPGQIQRQEINVTRRGKCVRENTCITVFRNELLRDIINLLTIDENMKEIEYTSYFKEPQRRYMKLLIKSINERGNVILYNNSEINMWEHIRRQIASDPYLKINIYVLPDKRIVLTKSNGAPTNGPPHMVRKNSYEAQYKNRIISISTTFINNIIKYMLIPFGPNFLGTRVLRTRTYRYIVLFQVLVFVKNNETSREVVFEHMLTPKQYGYVRRIVTKVNKKCQGHGLQFERDLFEEIKHFTGNDYLHVNLKSSWMSFILEKKAYKNPFVYLWTDAPSLRNKNIDFDNIIANVNDCDDDELAIIENDSPSIILSDCESIDEGEWKSDVKGHFHSVKLEQGDEKDFTVVDTEANNVKIKREDFECIITKPETDVEVKLGPTYKRCKSESGSSNEKSSKKIKLLTMNVCLVPKDYPRKTADAEFATKIQYLISKRLDNSKILPFLKCHGVKNGALMYSCHSEKSFAWLESLCATSDIKVIDSKELCDTISYKMAVRVNTFIDECYTRLFNRLEMYNEGLRTNEWVLVEKQKYSDFIVVVVKINEISFNYIKAAGFSLFAGVDEAKFSLIWD